MERVVARETPADHRCPYCHDALAGGLALGDDLPADDLVECDGCRTRHHRACIEELGRCTIRGCERSLHVAPQTPLDQPIPAAELRSAVRREVERRLRERARTFVQAHTRAANEVVDRAAVVAAHAEACAAEASGDLEAASAAWIELARRVNLARPGDVAGLELRHGFGFRIPTHAQLQDLANAAERFELHARSLAVSAAVVRVARALLALLVALAVLLGLLFAAGAAFPRLGIGPHWALVVSAPLLVVASWLALYAVVKALR